MPGTTALVYLSRLGISAARGLNLWRCKARIALSTIIHCLMQSYRLGNLLDKQNKLSYFTYSLIKRLFK